MAANAAPSTRTLNLNVKPFTITLNDPATPVQSVDVQVTANSAPAAPPAKPSYFDTRLEKATQDYNDTMSSYALSLGQRVQLGFGDGVKNFVGSWSEGILRVVSKQETIGSAFQKLITGMRTKLRDFFVKWAAEQVAFGAMDFLGIKTELTAPAKPAKSGEGGSANGSSSTGTGTGTADGASSGAADPAGGPGFFDAIGSFLKPDGFLGTLWSKISSIFKSDGLLSGLVSGISGFVSSLFKPNGMMGGLLSGVTSFISMLFHTGGIVGDTARPGRLVSTNLFAGAPRFHTGGLVAGEVPIIARKGEAVFTPEQMTNADRLIQAAQTGGNAVTQSVTVNVAGGSTGDREQDKALAERIGASVKEQLRAMMGNELRQQMRPGGMLNNMSYGG